MSDPGERMAPVLKRLLLAFWAVWLTLVFLTNLLDGLKSLGLLPPEWAFASGNYKFLAETTARYHTPEWLNALLFLGVICWEGLTAVLFWLALVLWRGGRGRAVLYGAFTAGLMLWGAFAVADEIFIAYQVEGTHLRLFTAQLVTLLALELLPARVAAGDGRGTGEPANFPRKWDGK